MLRQSRSHAAVAIVTALVFALCVPAARAEVLVGATSTTATIYGGASYTVDFNGAADGGTSYTFTTTEPNQRVMFTFAAECSVDGAANKWVDIDILTKPALSIGGETAVAPTGDNSAFCSGNGTTTTGGFDFTLDGWVSASVTGTKVFAQAGSYSVRVRVNGANAGIARLDSMSLTVVR